MMIDPLETAGWLQTALANGPDRCRTYGRYLGDRYKRFSDIIWLNGNDFQRWAVPANDAVMFAAVALGIKNEAPKQLQTLELNYQASCSPRRPELGPYRQPESGLHLLRHLRQGTGLLQSIGQNPDRSWARPTSNIERNGDEDGGSPHVLRMQEYSTQLLRRDWPALRQ